MSGATVQVAVGVILNADSEILISKRAADVHQANCWEFPGGKIESNESAEDALNRELYEELGIKVLRTEYLTSVSFDYGDKIVKLVTYLVTAFSNQPSGREGQPIQWVGIDKLQKFKFPDANLSIINILQLPDVVQITGDFSSLSDLIIKSKKCFGRGIKLLQFRAHQLNDNDYINYATELLQLCRVSDVKLILNRTVDVMSKIDADGLHLNKYEMQKYQTRPCASDKLFSVSCHNEIELKHAEILGSDYCFLSPVKSAISHDAGNPLGLKKFSQLVKNSKLCIYALGGMSSHNLDEIKSLKAKGIAVITENWS